MKGCRFILPFILFSLTLWAQTYPPVTLVGEVKDAHTGERLQGVSVYLQGTDYGTATTAEGIFLLRAPLDKKTTLILSAVGYKPQRYTIQPGTQAGIDVQLQEESALLDEVLILPGTNPALALIDSVRAHRKENDIPFGTPRQDLNVYVSDIQPKHLKRRLWKSLRQSMIPIADSTYLLPLYSSHSATNKTWTSLFSPEVWQVLLGDTEQPANFYHSTVAYNGTSFLSPLAANGKRFYTYLLTDSLSADSVSAQKAYLVSFRTKNPYYPTFNGTLCIDSGSYALRSVDATMPPQTNVNYLRHLTIRHTQHTQHLTQLFDIAVLSDTTHLFPSLLVQSRLTSDQPPTPSSSTHSATDTPSFASPDSTHLAGFTPPPVLRIGTWLAQIILTGSIPTGTAVDIGNITEILRVNNYEKVRLGLPLRTNQRLSEYVCLEGYAAYGFGDRQWKGAGAVHYRLPTERRHLLSVRYADEYTAMDADYFARFKHENSAWYQDRALTTHWTQPFYPFFQSQHRDIHRRQITLQVRNDWHANMESQTHLAFGWQDQFRYTQFATTFRLSWQEQKVDLFFHRMHRYNHLPVLYLNGEIGSIHPLEKSTSRSSYDLYGKLRVMLRQRVDLQVVGRLDYLLEAGWFFGNIPDSFAHPFTLNPSYAFDPFAFTLMPYYPENIRQYISLHTEWNGRGCLFNSIPYIQRLHLRELAIAKIAYGGQIGTPTHTDLHIPYIELGAGIGNILRIGDLYAVFRVTHLCDHTVPWWAVRFRLRIEE